MKRESLNALRALKEQYKERAEGFDNKSFFYAGIIEGIESAIIELMIKEGIED